MAIIQSVKQLIRIEMPFRDPLLQRLADGKFHSGQQLAEALGVSRTAIWKQIQGIEDAFGLSVHAVRGKGYRLGSPLELLDEQQIRAQLGPATSAKLESLGLLTCTSSTNSHAIERLPESNGRARVWLAEHQTAGRGRRGRQWVSAFGKNLYMSLAWRFELPMTDLAGLSLVAGVVVAEVLHELGLRGHSLKWPNDVLIDGRKLAGILVEASGEAGGPAVAVIGIGINVSLPAGAGERIDQPWDVLENHCETPVSRNRLAGMMVDRLIEACSAFTHERLAPFVSRWSAFDAYLGHDVKVVKGEHITEGIYRGIAASGAMLLDNANGRSEHHAGEVSLRRLSES
ncbi:bifunctional biotin--[acetyl-CoA-carboxylase] ligase/biotin operon repressor BirA [Thiosocius teredinicola]|uniref:bifunctional biotin--[acetyl-CoA-carboxylase] ligase/biotin operon repressor BirA n=1 Tax=Thiosocius teredinicola TaxID=1973002 RepID=UPI000990B13B